MENSIGHLSRRGYEPRITTFQDLSWNSNSDNYFVLYIIDDSKTVVNAMYLN